jgi:hypothetical protein
MVFPSQPTRNAAANDSAVLRMTPEDAPDMVALTEVFSGPTTRSIVSTVRRAVRNG